MAYTYEVNMMDVSGYWHKAIFFKKESAVYFTGSIIEANGDIVISDNGGQIFNIKNMVLINKAVKIQ